MAKKKKTYFQAISYTTDHCDGDLIAPSCWKPETDRAESANQIMQEINDAFGSILATKKNAGPDSLTIEYKSSTDDDIDWAEPKTVKNWKRASKFLDQIRKGLADGTISTVMVTVPEYLNCCAVHIDRRVDVFHINQFEL